MDPTTAYLAATLGSAFLGALFGEDPEPSFQPRMSFEGARYQGMGLDPKILLGQALTGITRHGQSVADWAYSPMSFSRATAVQNPVGYEGASDPALEDPSLLGIPGLENFNPFQGIGFQTRAGQTERGGPVGGDHEDARAAFELLGIPVGQRRHHNHEFGPRPR